jgi:hypothetical protein
MTGTTSFLAHTTEEKRLLVEQLAVTAIRSHEEYDLLGSTVIISMDPDTDTIIVHSLDRKLIELIKTRFEMKGYKATTGTDEAIGCTTINIENALNQRGADFLDEILKQARRDLIKFDLPTETQQLKM